MAVSRRQLIIHKTQDFMGKHLSSALTRIGGESSMMVQCRPVG